MFISDIYKLITPEARFKNIGPVNYYMNERDSTKLVDDWLQFQFEGDTSNFVKLLARFLDFDLKKKNTFYFAGPVSCGKISVSTIFNLTSRHWVR